MDVMKIGNARRIWLGYQGENLARNIQIDVNDWLLKFPEATIEVVHRRHGETTVYPVSTEIDEDGVLTWTPNSADTHLPGDGTAVFCLAQDNVVMMSADITTIVSESTAGAEQEDPPEEYEAWISTVIALKNQAQTAKTAAVAAQEAAETAQEGAEAAQEAAEAAQAAAEEAQEGAEAAQEAAAGSASAASGSASSAAESASDASNAAQSILTLTAAAESVESDEPATAEYDPVTGVMTFGIPKGPQGPTGPQGPQGPQGPAGEGAVDSVDDERPDAQKNISLPDMTKAEVDGIVADDSTEPTRNNHHIRNNVLHYFWCKIVSKLSGKVDKETGKGLSTNDYTSAEKSKLDGIEAEATKTVIVDDLTTQDAAKALSAKQGYQLNSQIGDLSSLPTTAKSSTVAAISELYENKVEKAINAAHLNLNDLTETGIYSCVSGTQGRPADADSNAMVLILGNNGIVKQLYCPYNSSTIWVRQETAANIATAPWVKLRAVPTFSSLLSGSKLVGTTYTMVGSFVLTEPRVVCAYQNYNGVSPTGIAITSNSTGSMTLLALGKQDENFPSIVGRIGCTAVADAGTYYVWAKAGGTGNNNIQVYTIDN